MLDFTLKLPPFYQDDKLIKELQNALQIEFNKILEKYDYVLNQFFLDSAQDLEHWEKMLNISSSTQDLEIRKANIKSKLAMAQTTTTELLKKIVKMYINADVEIELNHKDYYISININNGTSSSENLENLINTIEEIKPAHLGFSLKTTYTNKSTFFTFNTINKQNKYVLETYLDSKENLENTTYLTNTINKANKYILETYLNNKEVLKNNTNLINGTSNVKTYTLE